MLSAGAKLGPYEIVSPLGAGGMGEVYRALDTRLDRTVAIKILPAHLSDNPGAKERFEREAKSISSLNHPNICHLYDVGQQDGTSYLVMEYLEGETLADRLRRGRIALEQVVKVGVEICEGLEKAHRSGVVHRDLKPGNIMLTKTGAKLMDFGLAKPAKATRPPSSGLTQTLASAPDPLTAEGVVVGTFQYMSPEQVEGQEADARSDIFALGAVLYEMTTGQRAFEGKTTASTIAAILAAEPKPISTAQPMTPPALDRLIRTCLAKDPDKRWQNCADVARQLEHTLEATTVGSVAAHPSRRAWALLGAVALLLAAAAYVAGVRWHTSPPALVQFEVNPPEKTFFNFRGFSGPPVPSPDGKRLAFVAHAQGQISARSLWLRALDSSEARILSGTEGATYPFWSPDGRFVAFFAGGKLKKFDTTGGNIIPICDVAEGRGGTWSTDGVIVFGNRADSLYRVPASGGKAVRLTALVSARHETSHRFPQFLPDQKHFLYVGQAPEIPAAHLFVASLDAPEGRLLEDITSSATYTAGHLLYVQENALLARPFDTERLQFLGEPRGLAEHVQSDAQFNYATFAVGGSTLAYQTGAVVAGTRLVVYDRAGNQAVLSQIPELIQMVSLSPKEDRLALQFGLSSGQLSDVWIYDLHKNSKTKLTFNQHSYTPIWLPGGTRILFERVTADGDELVIKDVSGRGAEQVVYKSGHDKTVNETTGTPQSLYPVAATPDGKYLVYVAGRTEIRVLSLTDERKSNLLLTSPVAWQGTALSHDGKWLAYTSNESGIPEVYVVPFHAGKNSADVQGGKWQVSSGGGSWPRWRPDGKELLYANLSGNLLMSAPIEAQGDQFVSGPLRTLWEMDAHPVSTFLDLGRDGQKIYMSSYGPGSTAPIIVTLHWTELLSK